jgi:hypothetical protein
MVYFLWENQFAKYFQTELSKIEKKLERLIFFLIVKIIVKYAGKNESNEFHLNERCAQKRGDNLSKMRISYGQMTKS